MLRPLVAADLPVIFAQESDPAAAWMAAFTAKDPSDRAEFDRHWERILDEPTIAAWAILHEGRIAGNIVGFENDGVAEVCYWLGREFWGRGIATAALAAYLRLDSRRPLHARAATDNVGSLTVLARCGFVMCGTDRGFANARRAEVDETVVVLREGATPQPRPTARAIPPAEGA